MSPTPAMPRGAIIRPEVLVIPGAIKPYVPTLPERIGRMAWGLAWGAACFSEAVVSLLIVSVMVVLAFGSEGGSIAGMAGVAIGLLTYLIWDSGRP